MSRGGADPAMTSRAMRDDLRARLRSILGRTLWRVTNGEDPPLAGVADHVSVVWANVPEGAPEIDALNARESVKVAAYAPAWEQRVVDRARIGDIPVERVKLHVFAGRSEPMMRGKTGTPLQIIDHIVRWFETAARRARAGTSLKP